MDHADYIAAVEREVELTAVALGAGPLDAPVPTCPAWTVADLAEHLGEFAGWWAAVLCEATGREKPPFTPASEAGADLGDWFRGIGGALVTELRTTQADTPAYTWIPDDQSAGFIARRCANELAVHRVDAESARGQPQPIDAALAADGIEEIFVMVPAWGNPPDGSGKTLHLHGTDRGDEWTIAMTPDGLDVRREHADADLTLSGAVSDLHLVLFGRPPLGTVERDGDEAVLAAWDREFHFG